MSTLSQSPAWLALEAHAREIRNGHLLELFAQDPARASRFTVEFDEILLDYSKQRITTQTMSLLLDLARQADVEGWRHRMFAGEPINASENRAALHVALRADQVAFPEGKSVMSQVRECRQRMHAFVRAARAGELRGAGKKTITDIVNLGIGGSDLGQRLIADALADRGHSGLRVHFVANIDPAELDDVLSGLQPDSTLFIIASKSFTTLEPLHNARRAQIWLGPNRTARAHFVAVTANTDAAEQFGVDPERIFPAWDWVGGRFSICSAMGLSAAIAIGEDAFEALLEGARQMDAHFHTTPLDANLPVLMALLSVWNINFRGLSTQAVLPYRHALRRLPAYLQQLEMESNGKHVDRDAHEVDYATAPIVWGGEGTPSQHSFHQLLHQGTPEVPVDFIVPLGRSSEPAGRDLLVANALAQGAALLAGTPAGTAPQAASPGNRASSTLLINRLTPEAMGQLIALYEHKVFVQGVIWNINSFDQWGVELGKTLARAIEDGAAPAALDASTVALLKRARRS